MQTRQRRGFGSALSGRRHKIRTLQDLKEFVSRSRSKLSTNPSAWRRFALNTLITKDNRIFATGEALMRVWYYLHMSNKG